MNRRHDPRVFVHRIDDEGHIVFVNDAWLAFAAENGWNTSAPQIIGSPLMIQIADPETRHIYQLLIDRARQRGRGVHFDYRCDSPDCRRLLEMHIDHIPAQDQVEFRSRVLRIEAREPVELLDAGRVKRSTEILKMCGWCKAVRADHTWMEVERAVEQLGILAAPVPPRISHGICPACSRRMQSLGAGP
jgi:hypothetical protein